MSNEARRRILERRAAFVAATMSAIAAGASCDKPQTCLSAVADEKAPKPVDASAPADASAPSEVGMSAPCLSAPYVHPPDAPAPMPCLTVPKPRDAGKPSAKPCLDFEM